MTPKKTARGKINNLQGEGRGKEDRGNDVKGATAALRREGFTSWNRLFRSGKRELLRGKRVLRRCSGMAFPEHHVGEESLIR